MSDRTDNQLADDIATMLSSNPGQAPSPTALTDLGGWRLIAAEGASLANEPVLVPLATLVAREAPEPAIAVRTSDAALLAVAESTLETTSPALFADSLTVLITSPTVLPVVGAKLASTLPAIIEDYFAAGGPAAHVAHRAAGAVEALSRLSLAGFGSAFGLLALLERFTAPTPQPLGTSVVRAVSTAVDLWPHAASLDLVVRRVAGLEPAEGSIHPDADPEAVASDAAWALAGIHLIGALRDDDLASMARQLQTSATYLATARDAYARDDADVLLTIVDIVRGLLEESLSPSTADPLSTVPQLTPAALADLAERLGRFNVASSGLSHWYGDTKRATLIAWRRLADDLGRLRVEFSRNSFYKAEVVIDGLLQIYVGSRAVAITRRSEDATGIVDLVQPVIETGFARTAGLLSNLEDHTDALEQQFGEAAESERAIIAEKLSTSRTILNAARAHALEGSSSGKGGGGTAPASLPPPLDQLLPPGCLAAAEVSIMSQPALRELARAVDDRTVGRHALSLVESEVFAEIRAAVATSPDYRGDVATAVDILLRLIVRFVASRLNAQANVHPYLFDPDATEDAIHRDLRDYLYSSELGSLVEFEVQHVGGGRIDLRAKFDGFAVHIELKVDSTKIPIDDKTAYLHQAAAYGVADVRIGFLVALRHKAFNATGPPPHISALIGHTVIDIQGDVVPRHIVTVEMPGSRTSPSRMR